MLPLSVAFTLLAALGGREVAAVRAVSEQDFALRNTAIENAKRAIGNTLVRRLDATDYAPYQVDCPANVTWVRPASVSVDGRVLHGGWGLGPVACVATVAAFDDRFAQFTDH
jgi:hypothetical protein